MDRLKLARKLELNPEFIVGKKFKHQSRTVYLVESFFTDEYGEKRYRMREIQTGELYKDRYRAVIEDLKNSDGFNFIDLSDDFASLDDIFNWKQSVRGR